MIGETVGSYRIISKLSVGGMGTVYRAEHTLIGKPAAVKVLHPELTTSHEIVNRFFNEAKATTTIKHPGIVDVIDFGYMETGHAYLIMEFLEGMSLAKSLETRGAMSEGEAAMLLRSVCSALAAAHAKGIVHRDLKPDNIFMTPDPESAIGERPKILDFGIAKLTDLGLAGSATKTGAVMGTPTYMSPEQCRGTGDVDQRADLYSIGCIFYELVTGRPPFTELGAGELIGAHLFVEPESPLATNPELSAEGVALIMSLLAKKPAERPQTAKELAARLTVLAQKLGWITGSSPSGVTGPTLDALPLRTGVTKAQTPPPSATPVPVRTDPARLPSKPPNSTTPWGLTPPRVATPSSMVSQPPPSEPERVHKPTTLSGAASSILDVPRRSRKGIGVAMAAVAILAAGAVAFVKLQGGSDKPRSAASKPETAPLAETAPTPVAPPAPPVETKPVEATPPPVETKPVETAVETKPIEPAIESKPVVKKRPPKKPDNKKPDNKKPDDKKPDNKKPDKILIETDID